VILALALLDKMLSFCHLPNVRLLSGNNGPHIHVLVLGIQDITAAANALLGLQGLSFIDFVNDIVHLVVVHDLLFLQFVHLLFSNLLNLLFASLLLFQTLFLELPAQHLFDYAFIFRRTIPLAFESALDLHLVIGVAEVVGGHNCICVMIIVHVFRILKIRFKMAILVIILR